LPVHEPGRTDIPSEDAIQNADSEWSPDQATADPAVGEFVQWLDEHRPVIRGSS
jgi:hypothetical protein